MVYILADIISYHSYKIIIKLFCNICYCCRISKYVCVAIIKRVKLFWRFNSYTWTVGWKRWKREHSRWHSYHSLKQKDNTRTRSLYRSYFAPGWTLSMRFFDTPTCPNSFYISLKKSKKICYVLSWSKSKNNRDNPRLFC